MALVTLTLGDFVFANNEIPERINFGGSQMMSVKKLVGGKRVIDVMGRDDEDPKWSGRFRGSTALFRARFLDNMRSQGIPYPLIYSQFYYLVLIKDFHADFERTYEIPYSISVIILEDQANPIKTLLPVSYNDAIEQMVTESLDLANAILDPGISSAIALLANTINSIPDLNNADSATLASLQGPLEESNAAVSTYIAATQAIALL